MTSLSLILTGSQGQLVIHPGPSQKASLLAIGPLTGAPTKSVL
jgi:hypothetical protein